MPFAQGLSADLQRLPKSGSASSYRPVFRQKVGEVAEPNGVIRMPFAQSLPTDLQRLAVERLRLLLPARIRQKVGEVVEPNGVIGMPFAQAPGRLQRLPVEWLAFSYRPYPPEGSRDC